MIQPTRQIPGRLVMALTTYKEPLPVEKTTTLVIDNSLTRDALVAIFNEWRRRHDTDPNQFFDVDIEDYGESCADYFLKLAAELTPPPA